MKGGEIVATVDAGSGRYVDDVGALASQEREIFYKIRSANSSGHSGFTATVGAVLPLNTLTPRGRLSVPASLSLGAAAVSASVTKSLTLRNTSRTELLRVSLDNITPPFSLASGARILTLPPGGQRNVLVRFTAAQRGAARGTLALTSTDPARASVLLKLTAAGR